MITRILIVIIGACCVGWVVWVFKSTNIYTFSVEELEAFASIGINMPMTIIDDSETEWFNPFLVFLGFFAFIRLAVWGIKKSIIIDRRNMATMKEDKIPLQE